MFGSVTAQSLLHGAAYSLEHCGMLLGDAKLLYENSSYATALVAAAFAREELGRWRMLLKLRKRVLDGESFTVEDVKAAYDDQVRKQEAGMLSLSAICIEEFDPPGWHAINPIRRTVSVPTRRSRKDGPKLGTTRCSQVVLGAGHANTNSIPKPRRAPLVRPEVVWDTSAHGQPWP